MAGMSDIIARIDDLLANTPPIEIEEFEVTRCLRDCRDEIKRLRTQGDGLADRVGSLFRETQDLYRHIATQQPWIPVSERLPDIGVSVLCSSKEPPGEDLVWIGQREQYEWYFPGANEMGQPTHWQPLPESPPDRP